MKPLVLFKVASLLVFLSQASRLPEPSLLAGRDVTAAQAVSPRGRAPPAKVTVLDGPVQQQFLDWFESHQAKDDRLADQHKRPDLSSGKASATSSHSISRNSVPDSNNLQPDSPHLLTPNEPDVPTVFNPDSPLVRRWLAPQNLADKPEVDFDKAKLLAQLQSVSYCSVPSDIASWSCKRCAHVQDFSPHEVVYDPKWNVLAYVGYHHTLEAAVVVFRWVPERSPFIFFTMPWPAAPFFWWLVQQGAAFHMTLYFINMAFLIVFMMLALYNCHLCSMLVQLDWSPTQILAVTLP